MKEKDMENKIALRFGVFADARQESDVEERFTCAKIAADSVQDDSLQLCGFYTYISE